MVKTTACVGAGSVGSAWAVVFARAGCRVLIYDPSISSIPPQISETLKLLQSHDGLREPVDAILDRIELCETVEAAVKDAHYVQESVREDVSIKRDVASQIADAAPRDCLIASSTSAIPGSQFLTDIQCPERALVAHPVNPPSLIPLVELCATPSTNPKTLNVAHAFLTDAGMEPVRVHKEIDGFILNRLQYTLFAEAMHLVGEGYCSPEDVDKVMTRGLALRWASIGPFEVAHLNASAGFKGFVDQLGPMMKRIGQDARTDYPWDDAQVDAISSALEARLPVPQIPERQNWRNAQIIATRALQAGEDELD